MSLETPSSPEASLYGQEPAAAPAATAPTLLEQVTGVLSDPVPLFKRLNQRPVWGMALTLSVVASLAAVVVWALRVDADAMLRPILERMPQLSGAQIDSAIEMQKRFLLPGGALGALFGKPIAAVIVGLIAWGLGVGFREEGAPKPTFLHGLSFATVPGLVMVLHTLLSGLMAVLRPVGGSRLEHLSPTALGFYLTSESPRLTAIFHMTDLLILASLGLSYLGMRHILRAKPLGAGLMVGLMVCLMAVGVVFAR